MKSLKSFFSFPLTSYFIGLVIGLVIGVGLAQKYIINCPPCDMVHCTPEDTMKDLSVLELKDGESLTVTKQGDDLVFTVKALQK